MDMANPGANPGSLSAKTRDLQPQKPTKTYKPKIAIELIAIRLTSAQAEPLFL